MSSSTGNYSYLIQKIDEFIRKYYLNKVVRGAIYLSASLFASYVVITIAEYYGNFNELIRSVLFFSFLLLNLFIFGKLIFLPLLSYFRLGSTISHEQASEIIGNHFGHIKDKLLNTLQLKKLADENPAQKSLIEAGINQKIADLNPVPFTTAIKIADNRKYLRFAIPPLAVILLIAFTAPAIFSEGTERILHYNKKYVKKAPFTFVVLNRNLSVVQGDDLELKIKMEGSEIPQDIYIEDGLSSYKLDKENIVRFSHTFRNLQHDKQFRLSAVGFYSDPYVIDVKSRPSLLNFNVSLEYPAYLHKSAETLENTGDLTVPEGTKIRWKFRTLNTESLAIRINDKTNFLKPEQKNTFQFAVAGKQNAEISIRPENNQVKDNDFISYKLTVIPDLRPSIEVSEQLDSLNGKALYFMGKVNDDHGFSRLALNYRILNKGVAGAYKSQSIPVNRNTTSSSFFYSWDLGKAEIKPGQQVEYFFEVFDNDGFNGPKSARSETRTLRIDTEEETEAKVDKSSENIKHKMDEAIRQAKAIEKGAQMMNRDLLNKKNLSFDEKKQIEDLLNKQKNLENLVGEIRNENKHNLNKLNMLQEQKEEILRKQKQIDDLFNNVLDEKTKEILNNIRQLLEQNNKAETQQELSKMQLDNKSLQKELDRILELYKQLEFDQKLSLVSDKLNKLSDKQRQLSAAAPKSQSLDSVKKEQEQINAGFRDSKSDLEELERKNNELEKKNNYENPKEEQSEIEQQQGFIDKQLNNRNVSRAAEPMKTAAAKMKQLAEKLSKMQQENDMEENRLSIQNLREILANLLTSSFEQEKLLLEVRNTSPDAPVYLKLVQKQKDLRDNLKLVQDSLYSLSRKVPQLQSVVNKEIQAINDNIDRSIQNLADRRSPEANRNQQYALTSINNLALMLSEVEEQLQKMSKNAQPGGKGKQKSLSQLSKMQEQLNKNMQKVREQMKQQGIKEGQPAGKGPLSEQMAKMAKEQQLIRQALQEINRDLNKDGKGRLGDLEKLSQQMEQTETDFVHKKIKQETELRQQQILSKLLEAEKAERERETDNQRESKEGSDQTPVFHSILDAFKKEKQRETELLKTVPASLSLFYQLKVGDYFRHLDSK